MNNLKIKSIPQIMGLRINESINGLIKQMRAKYSGKTVAWQESRDEVNKNSKKN